MEYGRLCDCEDQNCESSLVCFQVNKGNLPTGQKKKKSTNYKLRPITKRQISLQANQMSSFKVYLDLALCPSFQNLLTIHFTNS